LAILFETKEFIKSPCFCLWLIASKLARSARLGWTSFVNHQLVVDRELVGKIKVRL
jgi:hypothetical protein